MHFFRTCLLTFTIIPTLVLAATELYPETATTQSNNKVFEKFKTNVEGVRDGIAGIVDGDFDIYLKRKAGFVEVLKAVKNTTRAFDKVSKEIAGPYNVKETNELQFSVYFYTKYMNSTFYNLDDELPEYKMLKNKAVTRKTITALDELLKAVTKFHKKLAKSLAEVEHNYLPYQQQLWVEDTHMLVKKLRKTL